MGVQLVLSGSDLSLLMQTEVAEAFEPAGEGRGGSSTMPQKRNPVGAAAVLAAAVRAPGLVSTVLSAMVQEHERGVGGWHAEWQTLPELCALAAGIVDLFEAEGLRIFGPNKSAAQLESSKIFAKQLMQEQQIPTAAAGTFAEFRQEFVRNYIPTRKVLAGRESVAV